MTEVSDVIVIGAGFAGLYAVHRVTSSGLSVTAIEAAPDVGGTWYWNRYPGARCDVESVDYSYSFDEALQQSWQWSERFAAQPEILAYLRHVADHFDLRRHYRFGVDVVGATFDQRDGRWHVDTATGDTYAAQFLLCATGCLSAVNRPNIPGAEDFSGEVYFTAAWPREDPELGGKRVGLIGTGSSGIQVAPIIAAQAENLVVFQRSANYSIPMPNRPWSAEEQQEIQQQYPERRRVSAYASAGTPHGTYHQNAVDTEPRERAEALWKRWREGGVLFAKTFPDQTSDLSANDVARQFAEERIREIVTDAGVAADLIPVDHPIGTKRICTDNGYYATFNRDNVRLVNLRREPIEAITVDGIRTNQTTYPCDVLIFATGFDAMTGALTRINPGGPGRERLRDIWADGPVTFLGLMVPGLPNLFTISGPGSPSVLANMVLHAEVQVDWVIDLMRAARQLGVDEVEPRRDAAHAWTEHVAQAAERTLFPKAASSWYLGANIEGKKRTFMPYLGGFGTYRRHCDDVADHDYAGLVLTTKSKRSETVPETVQQLLRQRRHDDTPAIAHGDRTWTWREHLAEAETEAAALIALADPARPLHVGAALGNSPAMLRAMAAAALGGYVLCGLNTTRRGHALHSDIQRSDCQILLVDDEHLPLLEGLDLNGIQLLDVDGTRYGAAVAAAPALTAHREVTAADTFMMIFTSGTSGNPKAVRFAHGMAIMCGASLIFQYDVTAADVCYLAMPLFHSNGVAAGWAVAIGSGALMVPAKFSPSRFIDDVRRYRVTYLNYVGKPLALILSTPERPDDADTTLRMAFGNEATDRDIAEFARRFGCRVVDSFGSSEFAVIVVREDGTPHGSIGRPYPGVSIYNPTTLKECAVAQFDEHGALTNFDEAVGELVNTQGAGPFVGYYNDPAATAERMRHGMYWAGDLAYRDADGWIYLAGRTADWMRVDGENLAAAPIERILERLPQVSQVAVYAVPDERVGDQVMAALVLRNGMDLQPTDLEQFLAAQNDLSPKAWPRYVRINDDLPATATNKILKRELIAAGISAQGGVLLTRAPRGTTYTVGDQAISVAAQPVPDAATP